MLAVLRSVDGVVRLVVVVSEAAVLAVNNRLFFGVITLGVEVAELVYSGERHVEVGVVHDRAALEVFHFQNFLLQIDGAPTQVALGVVEVAVDRAGVDDGDLADDVVLAEFLAGIEEVCVQKDGDVRVVHHALEPCAVAIGGQAFVGVREVAVVVGVSNRQAADDRRRQIFRLGLPLLGCVVHEERFIQRAANQRDALLDEVLRLLIAQLLRLLLDQRLCLVWAVCRVEELVDGAQVDWHRVNDAVVGGVDVVTVVREGGEAVAVFPDPLVGGVE